VVDGVVIIPLSGKTHEPRSDRADAPDRAPGLRPFLVGPENRLVEPAIRAVLGEQPSHYNPLVLLGPSGTGKSHLARGILDQWRDVNPKKRAVFTTAADFARELADAIDTQDTDEMRARYRKARLVVLEDIGSLAGKAVAQEELVHVLDALPATDSQVVVTALAPIGQLPGISARLRSRLEAGLTVPLSLPGAATRRVVLLRSAGLRGISLSEPVAKLLADGLSVSVPELDGALLQLEMPARLHGGMIDAEAVRSYLAHRNGASEPALRDIAIAAARFFTLTLTELRSASRRRAVVTARGVAIFLARQLTPKSLEQIGQYFGGRDHTTVMHALRKTEGLVKTDPAIRQAVAQLRLKWETKAT